MECAYRAITTSSFNEPLADEEMSSGSHQVQPRTVHKWIHQIDNTEKRIGPHQFLCMKLVVSQQYGGEQHLFSTDDIKLLDIFAFLKIETGSSEKALRVIVDLLGPCELQQCETLLRVSYPEVASSSRSELVEWNQGAKFALFLSSIYCAFSDQERKKFIAKLIHLLGQINGSKEEELLKSIVQNHSDEELVKKAVISMIPKRATRKKINDILFYHYNEQKLDFPKDPTCCFISCLAVLALLATPFIVSIVLISQLPTSYKNSFYAQANVVAAVRQIDPFWYNSIVITSSSSDVSVSVAAPLSCSVLSTTNISVHHLSKALNRTGNVYVPFQALWDYGYLLKGSSLNFNITIIDPPSSEEAPILYQLNDYDQYNVLKIFPPDKYIASHPLSITGSTNVTVDVNTDDTYLFSLYLPAPTVFQYEFWLNKVYYNLSDLSNFSCTSPCQFPLPSSSTIGSNVQCILMVQTSSLNSFSDISTTINRREFNVPLYIPVIVVLMLLLTCVFISFCVFVYFYCKFRKDSSPSYIDDPGLI